MDASIVIPVFNEGQNVGLLYEQITYAMRQMDCEYEIIFVNDGSTDESEAELDALTVDAAVRVLHLSRNFGQTAAMSAGIDASFGRTVITMDADLQNDPSDIPQLLAKLDEGFDLVHGWREHRQDALLTRRIPSVCANWLISRVTGFPVRDLGCTLKAMRCHVAEELPLYGQMHRFIPILAHWQGARCAELRVKHHPRRFGKTKYGLSRTLRVVVDLITVKFLVQYSASPMRLFGAIGFGAILAAIGSSVGGLLFGTERFAELGVSPLFISLSASLMAIQFFAFGILAEMLARTHFTGPLGRPYRIRRTTGGRKHQVLRRKSARAA